ncbi:MAG TPA: ASKHA domain-containing protein [Anaerolineae bacterium]|nr:ASKHA domain-containing protein [Anaerolineae bacterium]
MATHSITLHPSDKTVSVPTGALVIEALREAGLDVAQPCGGQGRCGRCAVVVESGAVRRRSTIRLSQADIEAGYALACQTIVEGDAAILVPEQEKVERRLVTDKTARAVALPFPYDCARDQTVRAFFVTLDKPTLADAVDDLTRLERGLAAHGVRGLDAPLPLMREIGARLREANWQVTAVVETDNWRRPDGPPRLIDLLAGDQGDAVWGVAIDIGTTTVSVYLVNLLTGEAVDSAAEYNAQISRGEDVISRIIYAGRNGGLEELQSLVRGTIDDVIGRLAQRNHVDLERIYKATVAGNTTMMHLFLSVPPATIRLTPYIPAINQPAPLLASEVGLNIHPLATVDSLPGVASYVGADITAGVLSSGLADAEELTLFIDVGTNGEIVLGNQDWLVTCACSAGPAFEGAGVVCGMRATRGAIEEVWINGQTFEPTYRVIGETRPSGLCGSGLIALVAELFITGVVDKGGKFKMDLNTPRLREGDHGPEYVVAWAGETAHGRDIVLTKVDVDNLMRAKAAIYAGFTVLAQSVGVDLADVEQVLVGGAFGKYINVEKAVQIGLLPDLPWDRFQFLGNTSVMGAYMALASREARARIRSIAQRMTYIELSADNTFYDAFTSALFLPHTDASRFPTVEAVTGNGRTLGSL